MTARALLIGGGNIGAGYDLDRSDGVRTHARAYQRLGIAFDLLDPDAERAQVIAQRYDSRWYRGIDELDPSGYEMVSICSPTSTHARYLSQFLGVNTPLILCEKPVAANPAEVRALRDNYAASRSIVLVNYMRRFLAPYQRLRDRIRQSGSHLLNGVIKYKRGLLNNGGHALDLLEFLLDREIDLGRLNVFRAVSSSISGDPTLDGIFDLAGAPVTLIGFQASKYVIFEIELNFDDHRVQILDSGDRIQLWRATEPASESETDCLKDYMLPVFETGRRLLAAGARQESNFEGACRLNLEILAALERVGNLHDP